MILSIFTTGKRRFTCEQPQTWAEMPVQKRFSCFSFLAKNPDLSGKIEALRMACRLPRRIFYRLSPEVISELLDLAPWTNLTPSAIPVFPSWPLSRFRPNQYLMPADNFANGSCMEFALADEYLNSYFEGDENALPLLTATLLREPDKNRAEAVRREDLRVQLFGRMEVEERAKRQKKLPDEMHLNSLMYFAGVKMLVHRLYGRYLFEQPDEDEHPQQRQKDPLGWWGVFMDIADGDVQKLDAVQQSNFHNFCTMEVRRRKAMKEMEMKQRLSSEDFGIKK